MTEATAPQHTFLGRMLDTIERVGNKVPHPAIIFVILIVGVIILSQLLYWAGASVTYEVAEQVPVAGEIGYPPGSAVEITQVPIDEGDVADIHIETETTAVAGLLTPDGIRFMITSPVANFNNFGVVGIILVAMLGVGLAEESGLIGAIIRLLVRSSPRGLITFIIVLIGILSSVATDAGYLVLIPLAAAAFHSMGRHPLAGLAAGFAGVGAAFGVNLLIAPIDGIMTEVANESIALVDPSRTIDVTANYFFAAVSTFFLAIIITVMTEKVIEPRLGAYTGDAVAEPTDVVPDEERRGLRYALFGFLGAARPDPAAHRPARSPAAQPGDGRDLRGLAVHDRHPRDHQPVLRRRGLCLWQGRRHGHQQRPGDQRGGEDVLRSGRPDLPAPDHRPVHRLLQLHQHRRPCSRSCSPMRSRRPASDRSRCSSGSIARDRCSSTSSSRASSRSGRSSRPSSSRSSSASDIAAAAGAGGVPRGRLAIQRGHAADGVLRGHRDVRPALPEDVGRRHDRRR